MRRTLGWVLLLMLLTNGTAYQDRAVLEGILSVIYADHPTAPHIRYVLHTVDGQTIPLMIDAEALEAAGGILAVQGQRVIVHLGETQPRTHATDALLFVEFLFIEPKAGANSASRLEPLSGERTWANLLCKFPDVPVEPFGASEAQSWFADDAPFLNAYWQESSFGQLNVSAVTSADWLTLPTTLAAYLPLPNDGYIEKLFEDCTALHSDAFNFADFYGINLIFNTRVDGYYYGSSCHFVELQSIEQCWRPMWIPFHGNVNLHAIAHEMGHNFGLPHSTNHDADAWPYENMFDIMSDYACVIEDVFYGCQSQHTIAPHKIQLGWIDGVRLFTLSADGVYPLTLDNITLASPVNAQAVIVPISDGHYFTVESRRNDFDDFDETLPVSGVVIHEVVESRLDSAWQVNALADSASAEPPGIFLPGETYSNYQHGFSVRVDGISVGGYAVTLTKGILPIPPDLSLAIQEIVTGTRKLTVTARVTNNGAAAAHEVSLAQSGTARLTFSFVNTSDCSSTGIFDDYCVLGDLDPGETADVTFDVYPTANAVATGRLFVSANETESAQTNIDNQIEFAVPQMAPAPDLNVDVEADHVTAALGSEVAYTVHLRNFGGGSATNVSLQVALPEGLSISSWDVTSRYILPLPSCSINSAVLTCTVATMGLMKDRHTSLTLNILTVADSIGEQTVTAAASLTQADTTPPDNVADHTLTVTSSASIQTQVMFQARPAAPNSLLAVPVHILLTPQIIGNPVIELDLTTNENGAFFLQGLPTGAYRLRVKGDHTLSAAQTIALVGGLNEASFGLLREGDANNDNRVTLADFSLLASSFSAELGDAEFDARADFNGDNQVTLIDFSLLASNFGQAGVD